MKVIQTQTYEDKLSINGVLCRVFIAATPTQRFLVIALYIVSTHQKPIKLRQPLALVKLMTERAISIGDWELYHFLMDSLLHLDPEN